MPVFRAARDRIALYKLDRHERMVDADEKRAREKAKEKKDQSSGISGFPPFQFAILVL
jgi:hypothetical protein